MLRNGGLRLPPIEFIADPLAPAERCFAGCNWQYLDAWPLLKTLWRSQTATIEMYSYLCGRGDATWCRHFGDPDHRPFRYFRAVAKPYGDCWPDPTGLDPTGFKFHPSLPKVNGSWVTSLDEKAHRRRERRWARYLRLRSWVDDQTQPLVNQSVHNLQNVRCYQPGWSLSRLRSRR